MTLQHVDILFKVIAFLFAISVHESAHAWMANRCGDPTARMLGRITLNPLKHIDIFGTILLPLLAIWQHFPMIGWAKPTPVDPRNFKHPVRDDIYTSLVGPISNFVIAIGATALLLLIKVSSAFGRDVVLGQAPIDSTSILVPISLFIYELMVINVILGVFNLIPMPPLDGSHVLRHFLSAGALRIYDAVGWIGLLALVYLAPGVLSRLLDPVLDIFNRILISA
jgi:Zn-dependent protease